MQSFRSTNQREPPRSKPEELVMWGPLLRLGGSVFGALLCCCSLNPVHKGQVAAIAVVGQKLLTQSDFTYEGAFKVPAGTYGCPDQTCSFNYGGANLAYQPVRNSLFLSGHPWGNKISEINIPKVTKSSALGALSTAAVVQNFVDLSQGNISNIGVNFSAVPNGGQIGGILVNATRLVVSSFAGYDGGYQARYTHFAANAKWSDRIDFSGMKIVGSNAPQAGFVAGYMAWIPSTWRVALGGSAITGQSNIPIITRTSLGPAAFVFDPELIEKVNSAPARALVYYPIDKWTLGNYGSRNAFVNQSTQIKGVVFPSGSRSVLFFGRHGTGIPCYGFGTSNQPESATSSEISTWVQTHSGKMFSCGSASIDGSGNNYCCYDPADSSKGTHGYPYQHQVWAYDARDLTNVRAGAKKPWDVLPYAVWNFDLPFQTESRSIIGAAYDSAGQRIFLSQLMGNGQLPVIHVFRIALPSVP